MCDEETVGELIWELKLSQPPPHPSEEWDSEEEGEVRTTLMMFRPHMTRFNKWQVASAWQQQSGIVVGLPRSNSRVHALRL
jgi:hypothetical protein